MTIEMPDHFGGKPIPEDAIEIALAKAKKGNEEQEHTEGEPLEVKVNINPAVPNRNILIAKQESLKGENWENTHYKLAENELFMPSPAIFMPYFINVRDAAKGNLTLYDGNNNPISRDEAEDLWRYLSTDQRGGCKTLLDARFYREKRKWFFSKWKIAYDHEVQVDSSGNKTLVPQKTEGLESTLGGECFVNIDFDRQGLPKSRSAYQYRYEQGKSIHYKSPKYRYNKEEDIHYKSPKDIAVARFYTCPLWAALDCNEDPSESHSMLGVFACAKKSEGKQ